MFLFIQSKLVIISSLIYHTWKLTKFGKQVKMGQINKSKEKNKRKKAKFSYVAPQTNTQKTKMARVMIIILLMRLLTLLWPAKLLQISPNSRSRSGLVDKNCKNAKMKTLGAPLHHLKKTENRKHCLTRMHFMAISSRTALKVSHTVEVLNELQSTKTHHEATMFFVRELKLFYCPTFYQEPIQFFISKNKQ